MALSIFRNLAIQIKILVAALIFTVLLLLLLLPMVLIYLYRFLITIVLKRCDPSCKSVLTSSASMFGVDDLETCPRVNIIIMLLLSGGMSLEDLKLRFENVVLTRKKADGSEFYPELKQYIRQRHGFLYWQEDQNFSLDNHLKSLSNYQNSVGPEEIWTSSTLDAARNKLVHKPWKENQSPWELFLVKNVCTDPNVNNAQQQQQETTKSALIFRAHHALADGVGLFNLLCNDLGGNAEESSTNIIPKSWAQSKNKFKIWSAPLKMPYLFSKQLIVCNDENKWKVPEEKLTRSVCSAISDKFPIRDVKEIGTRNNVSSGGVLLALLSGAIREVMMSEGVGIPEDMHAITPIPARFNRISNLRNYISYIYPKLATGSADPLERLKICDRDLKRCKKSSEPMVNAMVHKLAGSSTVPIVRALQKNVCATVLLSNFPGPREELNFVDLKVDAMNFSTSTHGFGGISVAVLSYNGAFVFTVVIDNAICPGKNTAAAIVASLKTEFQKLEEVKPKEEV